MSASTSRVRTALMKAATLPYGPARSAAIESLVDAADTAGDNALARDVRIQLISSYGHGGEPLKRFMPFTWLLDRYDNDPGSFDAKSRWSLLWMFKWVSVGALSHPAVSLKNIRRGLAEMEDRYRAAGEGLAPYYGCRVRVEAHVNGHAQAEPDYLAWTRAPRTELSDCEQCEPTDRVLHLAATARHAEAVGEALSVLHESTWCLEQPHSIIANSLESMLVVGHATRAAQEHVRGVRLIRGKPGNTSLWANHILILARTGRFSRGLDLLEDHLHEVDAAPTPQDAMQLAAAGARLLRGLTDQGRGDLVVQPKLGTTTRPGPASATEVEQRLTRVARDLAAQFDVRNQTGAVSAEVERWLDAGELPDLPLDEVASRRSERNIAGTAGLPFGSGRPGSPVRSSPPIAVPLDAEAARLRLAELDAAFQLSERTGSKAHRTAVLQSWPAIRESLPTRLDVGEQVAAALLDAAVALESLGEAESDAKALPAATARLRQLGQHAVAVRYDLLALAKRVDLAERVDLAKPSGTDDDPEEVGSELAALLAEADEHCTPADRGCLALPTMSILGAFRGQPSGVAEAAVQERISATLRTGLDLLQRDPGHALNPHQRCALVGLQLSRFRLGQPDDPIGLLRSVLALLPPGWRARERAIVGMTLAKELAAVGDFTAARTLLDDAAQDAKTAGVAEIGADAFRMLGRVHSHTGDAPAAVTAFSSARRLLQDVDEPTQLAESAQELVHALRAAGRTPEAAELAETALQQLVERTRLDETVAGSAQPSDGQAVATAADLATAADVAARLAFAGALATWDLGEDRSAGALARRSAAWHRFTSSTVAEAEALALAGEIESNPAESGRLFGAAVELFAGAGAWQQAARCRRLLAVSVWSADGLEPALESLAAARTALAAYLPQHGEETGYALEKLALAGQTARILADGGRLDEALQVVAGIAEQFRDVGHPRPARTAIALQAGVLLRLGRVEEALSQLTAIAEEALNAGESYEARERSAELARILDDLGRTDEAEAVWQRFAS
jgi:tetratricopeptide (TPR) repeat protein